eukprot:3206108-Karenia_brevis.AAC.1
MSPAANAQGPLIFHREGCHQGHSCAAECRRPPIAKAAPPTALKCSPTTGGMQTARHPRPCGRLPEPPVRQIEPGSMEFLAG